MQTPDEAKRRLYSIANAGRELDSSPWTLRAHISAGNIKVTRIGNRIFLTADEIERICREGLPSLRPQSKPQSPAISSAH